MPMVPMDTFSFIVAALGVYVSFAILVVGMGWRVYQWLSTPKSPVRLGMYPKPKSAGARFVKLMKDSFVFPQVREVDWKIWVFALVFHGALFAAFVGHLRLLQEFTWLKDRIGDAGMDSFGAWAGGIAGVLMLLALVYYVGRRTYGHFKQVSVPEDFMLLFILLGIVIMGDHMRFFGHIPSGVYQEYFRSVLQFDPAFPAVLANSSAKWSLVTHVLFVDMLFIYFPFSKLMHTVGTFATNLIRSE